MFWVITTQFCLFCSSNCPTSGLGALSVWYKLFINDKDLFSRECREGFSGTTIKDTWTKPRGRVDAREGDEFGWDGGGENADNCNWTIK